MSGAEPGDLLAGRYRLRAVIGRGGMGAVWLAGDEVLHRDVAVKEFFWPPQLDTGQRETLRQRALREVRTAARLNHPNIVGVYDVVEQDGRPWIVMQLVPYRSLSDAVREDGPLSPAKAAQVGLGILAALQAAHATGVLHRDVKPGNVLLGPEDQVVLTDFGMAIADGSPTLTTSGILTGSPSYMAPERARGERATAAADMWSLGATLYSAVEGRPPFDRDGTIAVLTAVVSDDPDPPSRAGPLWPVIDGLLRKGSGERLGTAEAERLLRRVAEDDSVRQGPRYSSLTPKTQETGAAAVPPLIPGLRPYPPDLHDQELAGPDSPTVVTQHGKLARSRRRLGAVATVALLAALAAAAGITAERALSHRAASPPGPNRSAARSAPPPSTGTSAQSGPSSAAPTGGGTGALPTGFHSYHDPSGFSIGVPDGWQISHQGHLVYIRDPSGGRFLLIDQTSHPRPDPLADWRQQEAARIGSFPGYQRIRLQTVHYAQAERAADWEFTYDQDGQRIHVLNRNVLANADHAYALYWSTPASQWDTSFHLFQAFAATFRPAGVVQGS